MTRPRTISSQPTGWRGRRAARIAPTVVALSEPISSPYASGASSPRSGRPAAFSRRSSQMTTGTQSRPSPHSPAATSPGQRGPGPLRTAILRPPAPSIEGWQIGVPAALRDLEPELRWELAPLHGGDQGFVVALGLVGV